MISVRPRTAAFVLTFLLALAMAIDLLRMPVQVFDSLDEILKAQASPSAWASFEENLRADEAHLRALRWAQTKVLYDLAGGEQYWLVYRGFHAVLLMAALLLFTAVQRVSTGIDLAASAFALVVFVGLRTFRGNVHEAYPENHFLEIVVLALLTLYLTRTGGGSRNGAEPFRQTAWADAAAVIALIAGALTLESGLLVWVIAAAAWLVGWRGVSMRAIVVMTVLVAGYAYLRAAYLGVDTPVLPDRSTGILFTMLDPSQLQERFGDRPALLHAYNVAASALMVLFSEPSHGVFQTVRAGMAGEVPPRLAIPVATSIATTALIAWTAIRWVRTRPRMLDDSSRFWVMFAIVLPANAALAYAYTKDEIVGVAGAFYALAAYAAMRACLERLERAPRAVAAAVMLAAAVVTVGWTVRAAGLHYVMRAQAFRHQNDWVRTPFRMQREGTWPADPEAQRLIRTLHDAAVSMEIPNATVGERRWVAQVWED